MVNNGPNLANGQFFVSFRRSSSGFLAFRIFQQLPKRQRNSCFQHGIDGVFPCASQASNSSIFRHCSSVFFLKMDHLNHFTFQWSGWFRGTSWGASFSGSRAGNSCYQQPLRHCQSHRLRRSMSGWDARGIQVDHDFRVFGNVSLVYW